MTGQSQLSVTATHCCCGCCAGRQWLSIATLSSVSCSRRCRATQQGSQQATTKHHRLLRCRAAQWRALARSAHPGCSHSPVYMMARKTLTVGHAMQCYYSDNIWCKMKWKKTASDYAYWYRFLPQCAAYGECLFHHWMMEKSPCFHHQSCRVSTTAGWCPAIYNWEIAASSLGLNNAAARLTDTR